MTAKARKQAAKDNKKRKGEPLESEKAKKGGDPKKNPVFMQPKNLAEGCVLKDYQLEGVRWMASLFENGVSGILADGMLVLVVRCWLV